MKNFSDVVYCERVTRRLTLRKVAEEIGISAMYLSQLENAKIIPDDTLLEKIADYYQIDLVELQDSLNEEVRLQALNSLEENNFDKIIAAARRNKEVKNMFMECLNEGVSVAANRKNPNAGV